MSRPSLAMQLGALRHCVAYAGSQGIGDEVVRNAEAGSDYLELQKEIERITEAKEQAETNQEAAE